METGDSAIRSGLLDAAITISSRASPASNEMVMF